MSKQEIIEYIISNLREKYPTLSISTNDLVDITVSDTFRNFSNPFYMHIFVHTNGANVATINLFSYIGRREMVSLTITYNQDTGILTTQ